MAGELQRQSPHFQVIWRFFFFFLGRIMASRSEVKLRSLCLLKGRRLHLMNSRKYVLNTTCQPREQIGALMFSISALNPNLFPLIDGRGCHCLHWLWECTRSDAVE